VLFDLTKKTFTKMVVHDEPSTDRGDTWGDPACPGAPGEALLPHGISLSKRADSTNSKSTMQLYVVNHGGRQSMEMFELRRAGPSWELAWHGCFVSKQDYNDVAALSDGGFIATHPTALRAQGDTSNLLGGQATGYVVRWTAASGEVEIPGTRIGYPNGVVVTPDGRYMYVNAWTAREVHKYDLKEGKETGVIKLDFMPDNLTWTSDHHILAAGVVGARGDCPAGSGAPCIQGFGVAQIDPAKMEFHTLFGWQGKISPISGVSVALKVANSIYLGAFQGDRIVKLALKK